MGGYLESMETPFFENLCVTVFSVSHFECSDRRIFLCHNRSFFNSPQLTKRQGSGEQGRRNRKGDSTPPEREPLNISGGLRPMFRSAPRLLDGVISPCSLPLSPCLFVDSRIRYLSITSVNL
ncbi:hypothetical protein F8R90_24910 [Nostoc sp. NZL]|nr:hypothetical protein [Nostoc sp. NZL]